MTFAVWGSLGLDGLRGGVVYHTVGVAVAMKKD